MTMSGLSNVANGCYINAALQLFAKIPSLSNLATMAFTDNTHQYLQQHKDLIPLLQEWNAIHQELTTGSKPIVNAVKFSVELCKYSTEHDLDFELGEQSDSTELFMFLLECVHLTLSREVSATLKGHAVTKTDQLAVKCLNALKTIYEKEYSEVYQKCYGIQVCKQTSSVEHFGMLFMPIPSSANVTLNDCFREYVGCEIKKAGNPEKNKKTRKSGKIENHDKPGKNYEVGFWTLPDTLIIVLKRFNNQNRKIKTFVDCPLTQLNLEEYVCGYNPSKYVYNLHGVCNHHGTGSSSGHYTSNILADNQEWFTYNDTSVTPLIHSQAVTANAYCLIYQREL